MTSYLTTEDLLDIAEQALQGDEVLVRDVGLLESAIARPQASFLGADAYPTVPGKAAALLQSLVSNHALVDGNKRLAFLAAAVFLDVNGLELTLTEDELFELVVAVASGRLRDIAKLTEQLERGTRPFA